MRIEPEEIDALVAEFKYVQALPEVDPSRVGYFGASVGGSLALVAAADPRIAGDVDQVVSFGGYYDALDTFGAIATERIEYEDVSETWDPRWHAKRVMAHQLINALEDEQDREMLRAWYLEGDDATAAELASISPVARNSYEFLTNRDPAAVQELIDRLPAAAIEKLDYLSPRTHVDALDAELFIVHDRADPFIPYTESRRLEEALGEDTSAPAHFDEIRLFEHVTPKLNQRPDIIALDSARVMFRMYQLLLSWE
jgi:dipeptidyl aminopeptidase/acylaminoacyl peptidase